MKLAVALVLVSLVVLVSGCVSEEAAKGQTEKTAVDMLTNSGGDAETANTLDDCMQIAETPEKDNCYFEILVRQGRVKSLEECDEITSMSWRHSCYGKVAEIEGDKDICKRIKAEGGAEYNWVVCYSDVACVTGDISICEFFEEELGMSYSSTSFCYKCVALKNNDVSVCEMVWDNSVRADCYDEVLR